ncbi:hypothetical protein DL766_005198 [Monosporascus sp. MC13-8B]|nr:hypothetical protein DL763_002414 [Monosporascus cannonballus]RYP29833.1 hypothetical protein DL766_005198 [Monosporascus sp. MC13-8B]
MANSAEVSFLNILRDRQSRQRPVFAIVDSNGERREFSFADVERASNRAAWFLHREQFDKFAYMGPNDIRYTLWALAAMKTGKCITGIRTLLHAPEVAHMVAPLAEATQDMITTQPTQDFPGLLSKENVEPFPFEEYFNESTPFMCLHTSGTSGHPKPVYWTHKAATMLASAHVPAADDNPSEGANLLHECAQNQNVLMPFPLFHVAGILMTLDTFFLDNTLVLPAPGSKLSQPTLAVMLEAGGCTAAVVPPSMLEAMLSYPPGLDALSKLKHVAYSGGPLNPARGLELSKHIQHLFPLYGSTEGGPASVISSGDNSRWNALKFMDVGQRMDEVVPGFYELVFTRTDLANRTYGYFHTQPHLQAEFRTKDLFSPADGDGGWWIYRGRLDSWVVMSNGLKMDPTEMENAISAHPDINGALVAGSHRFRLCLLIELKNSAQPTTGSKREILDGLWPTINEANNKMPKFGRVPKELVLFTSKDKPFSRTGKGTIQRRFTIEAYDKEIEELYAKAEEGLLTSGLPPLRSRKPADLIPFLKEMYLQILDLENDNSGLGVDDDLFARGIDSLAIFVVSARLKAALRQNGIEDERLDAINYKLLYTATTITQMAEALSVIMSQDESQAGPATQRRDDPEALLEKYVKQLPTISNRPTATIHNAETVVLTGSTGSLGPYILTSLLSKPEVKKVICLNRSPDAKAKQIASFQKRKLPKLTENNERVVFLQSKLAQPNLGLSEAEYSTLVDEATCIIHNAYPVNFLLSLGSFEPQIQAWVNLLKLAAECHYVPDVLFLSSIAAAITTTGRNRTNTSQSVPEAVLGPDEAKGLLQQGYALSKHICECLLEKYAAQPGAGMSAVIRVGQICGPLSGTGVWNEWEWFPSFVLSSKYLGAAPESIGGDIDWVPVDELGTIVSELTAAVSSREKDRNFVVYNVTNPKTTSWGELLPALVRVAPKVVPAAEWISRLENSGKKGAHVVGENPGLKLIDFYKQKLGGETTEVKVELGNLSSGSEAARRLPPIQKDHLVGWMQAWGL